MITKSNKLVVVWGITEQCNGMCRFCSYGTGSDSRVQCADKIEVARIGKILSDYSRESKKDVLVCWLGGEPFLWTPIADVSRLFREKYNLHISATTNGTQLGSKEIRNLVLDCFDEIVLSIDGVGEFHDWCRGKKGHFNTVKENLALLHKEKLQNQKNLKIKVNTILMRGNIGQFEELCNFLCDCGVEALTFNQLGGHDRPEFYPNNRLTPDHLAAFAKGYPRIKNDMQKKGLTIYGRGAYLERFASSAADKKIPIDDCEPGDKFFFISERGVISPCRATIKEYGIPCGEIMTTGDIDGLKSKFKVLRREKPSKACDDCLCMQVFGKFDL